MGCHRCVLPPCFRKLPLGFTYIGSHIYSSMLSMFHVFCVIRPFAFPSWSVQLLLIVVKSTSGRTYEYIVVAGSSIDANTMFAVEYRDDREAHSCSQSIPSLNIHSNGVHLKRLSKSENLHIFISFQNNIIVSFSHYILDHTCYTVHMDQHT